MSPPLCQASCRLDSSVIIGALRNDSGSIQQRIQSTCSGSLGTTGERGDHPIIPGDRRLGGNVGAMVGQGVSMS